MKEIDKILRKRKSSKKTYSLGEVLAESGIDYK